MLDLQKPHEYTQTTVQDSYTGTGAKCLLLPSQWSLSDTDTLGLVFENKPRQAFRALEFVGTLATCIPTSIVGSVYVGGGLLATELERWAWRLCPLRKSAVIWAAIEGGVNRDLARSAEAETGAAERVFLNTGIVTAIVIGVGRI